MNRTWLLKLIYMKRLELLAFALILSISVNAQVTWSEDAAQVFYDNCTACHNPNGIGPFPLMTYQDAVDHQGAIQYVVESGEMPPWMPDTTYQRYFHERILTGAERQAILDWVEDGALQGDPALAPAPPTRPTPSAATAWAPTAGT